MSYKLTFHPKALKEFKKLNSSFREQFKKKLESRLENPKVSKDKLSAYDNVYKIKLRTVGYRLAYKVLDKEILIIVLAVGQRKNSKIYKLLQAREK
ncbi:MAG: type II toxin-antitoxin system mRNA interferase toxin, RelE/StbE family [Sulfurimonas sp.]|nr:MAG: type II toxin-antitoxin system mRNA interferase toxin, RelE/StbE family [Sulfurimonas sp.]